MPINNDILSPAVDEAGRLAALHALALLDSEPEKEFDALVALAADMLGCPTALLSLIDRDRLWIKASNVPIAREVDRDIAYCDHTIRQSCPLVVPDLGEDARFRNNPMVVDGGNRFYAGTAIHVVDGGGIRQPIGALCVVDNSPRSLGPAGHAALAHLATVAEALIEARRVATAAIDIATTGETLVAALARNDRIFRQTERIAMIGSWRLSLPDMAVEWSENVYRIHGLPVGQMPAFDEALDFYPPASRALVATAIARSLETGASFDIEADFITADGRHRRVLSMGEVEQTDGSVAALIGVFHDITERHALEVQLRRSADTDALTGIANRAAFDRELEQAMGRARVRRTPLLLALVDLDGFKAINDTLGHGAGDEVLRMTGAALSQPWLRGCTGARIGGDEFALIVENPVLAADPGGLRERIEDLLLLPVEASGLTMTSAGSVGLATFDDDCHALRDLLHRADADLYTAKRARIGARRFSDERRAA